MKKMNVLITGGSGVLGRRLIESVLEKYKIIAIGKEYGRISETIRHHKNFKFYERDLTAIQSTKDFQIAEPIDLIIHLAGAVSGSKLSEKDFFTINAESTKHLAAFAKEKHSKAMLLASSVSVYGAQEEPIYTTSPMLGSTVYARSKIAAEEYLRDARIPYSIFRIASVYGLSSKSFIQKLFSLYKKGFYPKIKNQSPKSIIHIEDLNLAISAWIDRALTGASIQPVYVLSHPESVTIQQVIEEFKTHRKPRWGLLGLPVLPFFVPIFDLFYKILRKLQRLPYHESPLGPLLHSIEAYSEESWRDLHLIPKWDLRKGTAQYK
ncbi:NAD-dependent epimerase/dehydratase family protein [Leptospira ilyithenensis]|uniref:NAD(P)-dependent oxidoreductase n=1 Tax=Leptospira ilyithenensis TaxID=2484901 RepID=A0A4R9LUD8_9LEPT|nr:NAD(P)-dependent oxidoreductase [Leptospira ilyithenensis]TGN14332.1 NAD(P)-dependent oxidoreductase [Leptospira ilyithenensis]